MRWDNLTLSDNSAACAQGALFGAGDVITRTFDTPEFRGMTFYEVRARSVLNKVPGGSRMPFEWTVNPYRGCSHACRYCLQGETPILMADGATKLLMDLRVGDAIYGTVWDGCNRRYARTNVLAHWRTVKPAYRITLEDGTHLVASGDHRFLTNRGWKHVIGRMSDAGRRPYLTTGNELMGTGQFAAPPKDSPEYRRGYLCGMIRGDAHLGTYSYAHRANEDQRGTHLYHRFRLALIDLDALGRTRRYLADAGVHTDEFEFQFRAADGSRRKISAIRNQAQGVFEAINDIIRWPECPSDAWSKGFLAGIFDAGGSFSRGIFQIANTDSEIIGAVISSLSRFKFTFVVEESERPNDLRYVRLLGGICEQLRFFHTVDPAISRKQSIAGMAIENKTRLRVVSIEDLGMELPMYDITTGTGDFIANGVVSHNCFARRTHEYLDLDSGLDFDTKIVVKINAPELLRKQLASPRWAGDHIAMGTNVDPYQRVEGRYRLMPGILEALRDARNPFSILTKGTLVLRDLELLRQAANVTDVSVNVSVGCVDQTLWRQVEPGTPSPRARLGVCRTLADAGIGCGVLMAPILPYLSDSSSQLETTVRAIAEAGARRVTPLVLHLRPGAREWYFAWLNREHRQLVPRYHELYGSSAYAPKTYQRSISTQVAELARRYGVGRVSAEQTRLRPVRRTAPRAGPVPARASLSHAEAEQPSLL
ncbi:MAG TPA: intein-containing Rv2578c family radical SAM protein [Pseudonocardiaceae bacterium]|nr:intein-containing Rv2578c family radical SAM protein [Pseudonocardiaceae bacterium]